MMPQLEHVEARLDFLDRLQTGISQMSTDELINLCSAATPAEGMPYMEATILWSELSFRLPTISDPESFLRASTLKNDLVDVINGFRDTGQQG